jgi:predicted NAD/FAD-binding protein
MKLWDYDPDTLLPNLPTMVTFPKLDQFYEDWAVDLRAKGVDIRLNTDVTAIVQRSRKGIVVQTRPFYPDNRARVGKYTGHPSVTENFDEMVLAVLADDANKLLGKTSTWRERFVLGGARFFDDITITHCDSKYFEKIYETRFNPALCAEPKSKTQEDQIKFAKNEGKGPDGELVGYRPMYYTHSYLQDMAKIEMSFDCTNYQHQFRMDNDADKAPVLYDRHVFQSIFLDKSQRHLWTIDQIDETKIIEKKWWHQLGHRWQHYLRVIPGMMFINGKNHTWFAGSWTLVVSFLQSVQEIS